jgi:hypothetical protein
LTVIVTWLLLAVGYVSGLGYVALHGMYPATISGSSVFMIVLIVTTIVAAGLLYYGRRWEVIVSSGVVFLVGWLPLMGAFIEEATRRR